MSTFQEKYGPWALVTGASSGLGKEFARQVAERGLNVILVARREKELKAVAKDLKKEFKVDSKVVVADLSKANFMTAIRREIKGLDIGLLINNAGFGSSGPFLDSDKQREIDMVAVNCSAPVVLTHEIGNTMRERGRGGMIFLSSILGFFSVPQLSNYTATKSWNLMFGEALAPEMRKFGIDVLSLCPGVTETEFASEAGMNLALAMKAKTVVRIGLNSLGSWPTRIAGWRFKMNYYSLWPLPRRLRTAIVGFVMKFFIK